MVLYFISSLGNQAKGSLEDLGNILKKSVDNNSKGIYNTHMF